MTTTMRTYDDFVRDWQTKRRPNIRRAAQKLDIVKPGWAERVDVSRLNLRSIHDCVLAQVFKHDRYWHKPWTWIGPISTGYGVGEKALRRVGFRQSCAEFASPDWHDFWVEEITERQKQAADERNTHTEHSWRNSLRQIGRAWIHYPARLHQAGK